MVQTRRECGVIPLTEPALDFRGLRPPAGSWGTQVLLENNTANSVFWPTLAIGPNGNAAVTWYFGTSLDVQANVFR